MAYRKFLILAASLLACGSASAAYQSLVPPVGWSEAMGRHYYKPAAAEIFDAAGRIVGKTSVNVAGRSVALNASMKIASTAGGIAGRLAFANPAAFAVITAGTIAYAYWNDENIFLDETVPESPVWMKRTDGTTTRYCYSALGYGNAPSCATSSELSGFLSTVYGWPGSIGGDRKFCFTFTNPDGATGSSCPVVVSLRVEQIESSSVAPATEADLVARGNSKTLPPVVINEWPQDKAPFPVPVDPPVLNPSPAGIPQPLRIPQGDPQPIANTDPQQWKSPVIDITPSPTVDDPWRVDVQPKDIIKQDSNPLPDQESQDPEATPDPNTSESPAELDLCAKYPDILACKKFDEVPDSDLPEIERPVTITPDSGWGGAGSCPATRTITVQGHTIPIPLDLICQYMEGLRPIIIAMAWLSAGFILLGARGGD